jgi:hypothetical protein
MATDPKTEEKAGEGDATKDKQAPAKNLTYAQATADPSPEMAQSVTMPENTNELVRLVNKGKAQMSGAIEQLAFHADPEWQRHYKKMQNDLDKLSQAFRNAAFNQQAALAEKA